MRIFSSFNRFYRMPRKFSIGGKSRKIVNFLSTKTPNNQNNQLKFDLNRNEVQTIFYAAR